MNKLIAILLSFFPILALADSSLSFTPPATDYSVVFLGNLFGIVDGVLHGTGSQIMGSMFAVFNAAVLALGGIIITYTLIVSTMNTAHEGQMLGQKWSSIWIPVRSTAGLALLIPKASGYCLMQIFVMWVVIQGVGAADKIWEAALSYLNRGGVIIQSQGNAGTALLKSSNGAGIPKAATIMLAGQVCMLGLQNQLQSQLQGDLTAKGKQSGDCYNLADPGTISDPTAKLKAQDMINFCQNNTVPNFINTVDFVSYQNTHADSNMNPSDIFMDAVSSQPQQTSYTMQMPNFDQGSIYAFLNGQCGSITWNSIAGSPAQSALNSVISGGDLQTAMMSRVIAIQQMYQDLTTIAQTIVNNNPLIGSTKTTTTPQATASGNTTATESFGIPMTASGSQCVDSTTKNCVLWGMGRGATGTPLLSGTDFQGAISDYNGVMLPTLTLMQQSSQQSSAQSSRAFIAKASDSGWMMAGSYFFDLIMLNAEGQFSNGQSNANLTDTNSGLGASAPANLSNLAKSTTLVNWLGGNTNMINAVEQMIDGSGLQSGNQSAIPFPVYPDANGPASTTAPLQVQVGLNASTVYGYAINAMILRAPGQPGMAPLQFANQVNMKVDSSLYSLPEADLPCGSMNLGLVSPCVGRLFGNLFYNLIFRYMYNFFLSIFGSFINQTVMAFIMIPMSGAAAIFKRGLDIIDQPNTNPIVALAQMGTYYINFSGELWIQQILEAVESSLIPIFGIFIFALISLTMPILISMTSIMVSIGFSTAYYLPTVPYMIFTFGAIAWLMAVIEAMVAAPIVALGVTHPEGHEAFGKGEQAVMILMNVFLRPSMMIIGYIAAIALSYVSVWIINAGFDNAIAFVQGGSQFGTGPSGTSAGSASFWGHIGGGNPLASSGVPVSGSGSVSGGYTGWAGLFAYFFSIIVYTMLYLTVVQKSFTMIVTLPDKVLRWIGGTPESYGSDVAQWGQDTQSKVGEAGTKAGDAQRQVGSAISSKLAGGAESLAKKSGGSASAKGTGGGMGS